MSKLNTKIIKTVIFVVALIGIIGLTLRYFGALFAMDDDLMFIYGLSLMALSSFIFLLLIFTSLIADIWKTKKRKNKEK